MNVNKVIIQSIIFIFCLSAYIGFLNKRNNIKVYLYEFPGLTKEKGDLILQYSKDKNIDPCLVYGIIMRETGGKHYRPDGTVVRGGSGEYGIMQVMPFNFRKNQNYYSIHDNIDAGTFYLRKCLEKKEGDYFLASSCYNKGLYSDKINYQYSEIVLYHYNICKNSIDIELRNKHHSKNNISI